MMRVLCSSLPSDDLGLPSRLLPVAAELRTRGHEVAFVNHSPAPAKLIASAGFDNLKRPPISVFPKAFADATKLVRDFDHFMAMAGAGDDEFTAHNVERCKTVLQDWRPDVLLDSFGSAWCTAARITGLPFVEILQGDLHPDGPGFTWWLPREPSPTPVDAFNKVLGAAGLGPVDRAARLLLGTATVVVGSPATDPVPDPRLQHVGVLAWGDAEAELPTTIPPRGRRPLVYLYGGKPRYFPGATSWGDSAVVLDSSIEALAAMDLDVIVGAGYQEVPDGLPANFIELEYAPGQALARRADVMIHHGGHGSTLTALAAGTPALIIPTYSERESNGRRAAALGAALCVVPETKDSDSQLEPNVVHSAIQTLLEDSRYKEAALRAARDLNALPGAPAVADAIEAVVLAQGVEP